MTFKSFIDSPCGIRYMLDTLKLHSPCGRKMLLDSVMMRNIGELEKSYRELREIFELLETPHSSHTAEGLAEKLHCLRDISGTIARLKLGAVLDDIELFEVKYLAILAEEVREVIAGMGLNCVMLPNLSAVVTMLDPDGLKIRSFYVYDAYSAELREVRGKIKKADVISSQLQQLTERMLEMEGEIRKDLSGKLQQFAPGLEGALRELAKLDILFAKSVQMKELKLCFPEISMDGRTTYQGMFHPQIKAVLQEKGRDFVPIDIDFALEPVTIIGANMGGKTVVLKMAALNQLLFQFGFGIPAKKACVDSKNAVLLCIGDEQDIVSGLSSFAAEVKAIDGVLCRVKRGERVLALIDEPARTTNPVEGTALVGGLVRVLWKKEASVLLTTHYNIEGDFYRRLRVKGLTDGAMDYTLIEAVSGEIPHEAVGIAESLGIDKEWIGETKKVLRAVESKTERS